MQGFRRLLTGPILAARGKSTIGRAHRACEASSRREEEAMRDIVDDEQRRDCPQPLCAQRVPAAQGHLHRWRSSTMSSHRLASTPAALGTRPVVLSPRAARIIEMTSVLNNKRLTYLNAIKHRMDLGAAALQGAAAGGHLRRCRSSTMSPHRLRCGPLHLPARRSRQNINLFLREPLLFSQHVFDSFNSGLTAGKICGL
jgi:hypothetical protein